MKKTCLVAATVILSMLNVNFSKPPLQRVTFVAEVEAAMDSHPEVRASVATIHDDGAGSTYLQRMLEIVSAAFKIDLSTPFEKLPAKTQTLLLYGPEEKEAPRLGFRGVLGFLKQNLEESTSESYREWMLSYMSATTCQVCRGKRLRAESVGVKINGLSIADFTALPVSRSVEVAGKIQLNARERLIAGRVLHEISERLQFLDAVGLGYISLDRSAATLSGGEGQRIRLATQIGSKLRGVLYVLDEPSKERCCGAVE